MSSRPLVASRMRLIASCARMLTGCVGSWPVASLYENSGAAIALREMLHSGAAADKVAPAFRKVRRLMPCGAFERVVMVSSSNAGSRVVMVLESEPRRLHVLLAAVVCSLLRGLHRRRRPPAQRPVLPLGVSRESACHRSHRSPRR